MLSMILQCKLNTLVSAILSEITARNLKVVIKDEPLMNQYLMVIWGFPYLVLLCSSWLRRIVIPRSYLEGNWEYLNAKLLGYSWAFAEGEQENKSLLLSVLARILSQRLSEKAMVDFFSPTCWYNGVRFTWQNVPAVVPQRLKYCCLHWWDEWATEIRGCGKSGCIFLSFGWICS